MCTHIIEQNYANIANQQAVFQILSIVSLAVNCKIQLGKQEQTILSIFESALCEDLLHKYVPLQYSTDFSMVQFLLTFSKFPISSHSTAILLVLSQYGFTKNMLSFFSTMRGPPVILIQLHLISQMIICFLLPSSPPLYLDSQTLFLDTAHFPPLF